MKKLFTLCVVILLFVLSAGTDAATFYVRQNGTGNGSTWGNASSNLVEILRGANFGDEVWVAAGTYTPGSARESSFDVKPGVKLYGGFSGTETMLSQRNWLTNITTLSGADFNYHVVTVSGNANNVNNENTRLDGFTITRGRAFGNGANSNGGGLYIARVSPTIANCIFQDNSSANFGGGMYSTLSASPAITNCTFIRNEADGGGGVFNDFGTSSTITNCTFSNNTAGSGGGIDEYDECTSTITNCTFSNNISTAYGGAVAIRYNSNTTIDKCSFFGNSALYYGGAVYNAATLKITNSSFSGNIVTAYGGGGGGISGSSSAPTTITNCTITRNSATNGGGIHGIDSSSYVIANTIIWLNSATSGNEIYHNGSRLTLDFDVINNENNDIRIVGATITSSDMIHADPKLEGVSLTGVSTDVPENVYIYKIFDVRSPTVNGGLAVGNYTIGGVPVSVPDTDQINARRPGYIYNMYVTIGSYEAPIPRAVEEVMLSDHDISLEYGNAYTLSVDVLPIRASNRNVIWSSSNTNIATIDQAGVVRAFASGVATITARAADGYGAFDTCIVRVSGNYVPVSGVTLNRNAHMFNYPNVTYQLKETVLPVDATNKTVTWNSNSAFTAEVNASGLVTARSAGFANITVRTNEGAFTDICRVFVSAPNMGDMIPNRPRLPVGTPNNTGIVSAEPVIVIPADPGDISRETEMIASMMPNFIPEDFHLNEYGVITIEDWIAKELAERLLNVDHAEVITIPVFEAVLNNPGETAAVSFLVKGRHLMVDGLISRPERVRLLQVLSADSGDWYTYRGNAGSFGDKTFSILDTNGNIINSDLEADGDYVLHFMIKDGGDFDLDRKVDGAVWGVLALVGVPVTDVSLTPETLNLLLGNNYNLSAGVSIIPSIADNPRVTWILTGDSALATVNQNGIVTANNSGNTGIVTVTVNTVNGGYTANCVVTVQPIPVTNIRDVPSEATVGIPLTLTGVVEPPNATNRTIVWSVFNAGTTGATISGNTLNTTAAGTVIVRATIANGTALGVNYTQNFNITVEPPFVPVTNITGVPNNATAGTPLTLTGTVVPSDATNRTIVWSVFNAGTTGATVSGNTLNTTAAGTVIVRATIVNGLTRTTNYTQDFTIAVAPAFIPATGVTLNKYSTTITSGANETLIATVQPPNATIKDVTWSSSNTSLATVTQSGVVTANIYGYAGDVNITVTTVDGGHTAVCVVTVPRVPVTGVTLNRYSTTIASGASETLIATVQPSNATNKDVTWSSSNNALATVTQSGVVTANSLGNAGDVNITVTTVDGGRTAVCVVTVPRVPVTGVTLNKNLTTITSGANETLIATVQPPNATNKNVSWVSSNTSLATVNSIGTVTANNSGNAGSVTITVTTDEGGFADNCIVTIPPIPVTNITGVPSLATAGTPLTLTGTVVPSNATNRTIVWSVFNAGTTGASISGNTLNTTAAGTVIVRATIVNGLTPTSNFTKDFTITVAPAFVPVTDITGVPTTATAGTPLTLTGTVVPSNATNRTIVWSVFNAGTTGATISGATLNTTAAGTVIVRATIVNGLTPTSNFTKDFTITVQAAFVPVTDITGVPTAATAGTPLTLTGTVVPSNATNRTIVWSVVNAGTTGATISGATLNTTAAGTVIVRATIVNGLTPTSNFTKDFTITVQAAFVPVTDITGVPTAATVGTPLTLTGTVVPSNATNRTIVWSVSSAGTTGATISGNTLNTTAAGEVIVKATIVNGLTPTTDFTLEFKIAVEAAFVPVTDITGVPTAATVGTPLTLTGTVVPSNATNRTIVWSIVNAGTTGATISGNTLNTTAAGSVVVRATIVNGLTPTSDFTKLFIIDVEAAFVPVTDITGVPTTATAGTSLPLTGTVVPSNATNRTIVWSVVNAGTTGATISGNTLNTTAAGTVIVRATIVNGLTPTSNFTKDFTITVQAAFVPVTDITGVPTAATAGTPLTLTGTVVPSNATNRTIVWSLVDAGTTGATINGNILNTTAAGSVVIRATIVNGLTPTSDFTKLFIIDVQAAFVPVTDITGVPTTATAGTPLTLTGTVVPSNATNRTIVWSVVSAGTTGATISGATLNTTAAGMVIVRATIVNGLTPTSNFTKDFAITVEAAFVPVTDITGVPTAATVGTPLTLTGTVVPSNATNRTIIWSVASAGTTGATISGNTLNTTAPGEVIVGARIVNGLTPTTDFTQDYKIAVGVAAFVPVTDIIQVPNRATVGTPLTLTGTVVPSNATNRTIAWSLVDAGTTGATINGNTLNTTAAGAVVVRATIVNGLTPTSDFTKLFIIDVEVLPFVPVTDIVGVPDRAMVGAPLTLTGTVVPSNATNRGIVWSVVSAGTTGATISGNILNTTADGTVIVRATIVNGLTPTSNFTKNFTITVSTEAFPVLVIGVTLNTSYLGLNVGDSVELIATIQPANATDKSLTWHCDSPFVATVSQTGLVTAIGAGPALITVTTVDGRFSAACYLYVSTPVSRITITPSVLSLDLGEVYWRLEETVEPFNVSNANVVWRSDNTNVATVSQIGVVSAVGYGTATITATATDGSGVSGSSTVHVSTSDIYDAMEILTTQPELPVGTPTGIVSAEPIVFIPADFSDISLETDMLEAMMPGINSTDLRVNEHGVITFDDQIAKEIAKKLLSEDQVGVITIPVFEAVLNNNGEIAAVSFRIKGSCLMMDGLIDRPENVWLLSILPGYSGDWYTYTDSADGLGDKTFTILDMNNNIFTGDFVPDDDYILVLLIKDGGDFDLDGQTDGSVWGVSALISVW